MPPHLNKQTADMEASALPKEGSLTCLPKVCGLAQKIRNQGFLIASDLSLQPNLRYKGKLNFFTKLEVGGDAVDTVAHSIGAD